ncbi:MAG TPA: potassium-transporting ATPase subunit KdpC [Hyphomicrobiaceae bacterium]|nr:potassium-transporting ATPase subunit KdpC [Hyphomicrobiaceae bacterium]
MLTLLRPALVMLALFTLVTGVAYPLAMTVLAQALIPATASGSVITRGGTIVGSDLIAQSFTSDRYFRPRPSAAGEKGYDATGSSGSNLGPLSKKLIERVEGDVATLRKAGASIIPADAVTTSASGLDPHISPAFAGLQIARVAAARNVTAAQIRAIVENSTERPLLGLFGEPRINVLRLNLTLDASLPGGAG